MPVNARRVAQKSRVALAALAALGLSACVPVLLPPGRLEISEGQRLNVEGAPAPVGTLPAPTSRRVLPRAGANDLGFAAGVHLASMLRPEQTRVDVGIGYVFSDVGLGDRTLHGMYGEVGPILWRGQWARAQFSARGEALFADRDHPGTGYALFGRLGLETFTFVEPSTFSSPDGVGVATGTAGFGMFVEAGNQKLPGGEHAAVVAAGLSLRTPAAFMLACCVLPK